MENLNSVAKQKLLRTVYLRSDRQECLFHQLVAGPSSIDIQRVDCGKPFARLDSFRAARVAMNQLLPAFPIIMKPLFPRVEDEGDSLPVVAIETVEIEVVAKERRASGSHLSFIQPARSITGEMAGNVFSSLSVNHEDGRTEF